MSTLVLQPRMAVFTEVYGVEVGGGVKVRGTEVVGVKVIVAGNACVSVLADAAVSEDVGMIEVLVEVRSMTLEVAVTGNGRIIGVGLEIIGVEVGNGVEVV